MGMVCSNRVVWDALKDAMFGHMGLHKIYRPGWKPDFDR